MSIESVTPSNHLILCHPLLLLISRQEYWSGLPFPPRGDLPELGIALKSFLLLSRGHHLLPHE